MKVLVTGGAGFIGSHLVDRLLAGGHDVVVLDVAAPPAELGWTAVTTIRGDVRDREAVRRAMAGVELVFHLAARTDLAGAALADYDVNLAGTENVAAEARAAGVRRLVFFSSMLAVGLTGRRDPLDETSTLAPQSRYGESKLHGEATVRGCGVPFTIVRPTLVYGPRERATMHAFMSAVYRHRFLLIGPDVLQAFVYVGNLVAAAHDAAFHPGAEGGTYFVSDASPYTLAEFAGAAAAALRVRLPPFRLPLPIARAAGALFDVGARIAGRELILSSRRVGTMTTHYVYSIERARRDFGYAPPFGLDAAVAASARWYLERGLL